jgi:hypothetical protein
VSSVRRFLLRFHTTAFVLSAKVTTWLNGKKPKNIILNTM